MRRQHFFWWTAAAGLICDQVTKWLAMTQLSRVDTIALWTEVFHLTYRVNDGAAWGILAGQSHWLRWISLFASFGIVGWVLRHPRLSPWEQVSFGLILAGAAGNGFDRFYHGYVIDFFDLRLVRFPVFNVADVCISLGFGILMVTILMAPTE
ncbi:MAG: lipoprotein signal peptidase [Oscillatoriales cyanobacterium SM2_2_1]|nr:lipoprotein signal peptidase [Oscillatoriales cyanobacterium SM2_2_1]